MIARSVIRCVCVCVGEGGQQALVLSLKHKELEGGLHINLYFIYNYLRIIYSLLQKFIFYLLLQYTS
jgi:hypothetical protein